MREGLLGWRGAAAGRPAGQALGTMDTVAGMEVGAEIEVMEDGVPEELPLHLENAKNCLSWESLDISSSDDDGEAYLTFCLPVRRPPRPAQRITAQRPSASPVTVKPPPCEKRIPPLYTCPLRPSVPIEPIIPTFEAYQCQQCLQVFMEEWHYAQHLQDHLHEEAQQRMAQLQTRSHSLPRKLRCLECGKRFLHPEHFARHTKWHLKLLRKGIKLCRKKGGRHVTHFSYVYKPHGTTENQVGTKDASGILLSQENAKPPKSVHQSRLQRGGKRKVGRHKRTPTLTLQDRGPLTATYPENSVAILDGEGGVSLLQHWPKDQESILEGQATEGLFQPAIINAENQIIILDDSEAVDRPMLSEHHYAEVQTAILDGEVNAVRPLFLRAEDQAAILDAQVSMSSLQLGGVKEQVGAPGWVGQNPCTLFRTVLLQAEEQATILDGPVESSALQQVIFKTAEVPPTLYLDSEPQLSSLDSGAVHFVPVHQEPQYVTLPYSNSLTLDHTEALEEGDKAWESQVTTLQLPSYLPNFYQQTKQPSAAAIASPSPKGPLVVRLVPCASGDHPEVLDLEYDMGGGIPVATEPWEASVGTGQEIYNTEEATEDNFIVVTLEADACNEELAALDPSRGQILPEMIKPTTKKVVWRFKCLDCGVCYSQESQLRAHQKGSKRQGRRHLCECGTSFHGLLHLLRHQLQHLEKTSFFCATCGKVFKGHRHLTKHRNCRSAQNRFGCHCGLSFRHLSRCLWHHVKSQQSSLRVYTLSGFLSAG